MQGYCDFVKIVVNIGQITQIKTIYTYMKLHDIDFGTSIIASGTQNFGGEGWWYHLPFYLFPGFTFKGTTFVSKTTTLAPREGNMPLIKGKTTPREIKPKCIYVNFLRGYTVNNVSLSGPGFSELLKAKTFEHISQKPWMLSFMTVGATLDEKEKEIKGFVNLIKAHRDELGTFAIQLNVSCPNTGHDVHKNFLAETEHLITFLDDLNVPLVLKISAELPIDLAKVLSDNERVDAFCVSNTIPWDNISDVDKLKYFGRIESPLAKRQHLFTVKGNGGVSGKYLLPRVKNWVFQARLAGIKKPIIAGGGILCKRDVKELYYVGADAISPGTVAMLRPWRLKGIIRKAQELFTSQAYLSSMIERSR